MQGGGKHKNFLVIDSLTYKIITWEKPAFCAYINGVMPEDYISRCFWPGADKSGRPGCLKNMADVLMRTLRILPLMRTGNISIFSKPKDADRFLRMAQLLQSAFGEGKRLFTEFKGALWKITCFSR